MAYYLVQIAYTPEAWAAFLRDPQNRIDRLKPWIEKLGGEFVGAWFAFGDYDLVEILRMPDNVGAAAHAMAAAAGGAIKELKTTPLVSLEDGIEAMKKAAASAYQPPR